jgi:hypothetical protein
MQRWAVFNTKGANEEHYKQAPNEVFIDNAAKNFCDAPEIPH